MVTEKLYQASRLINGLIGLTESVINLRMVVELGEVKRKIYIDESYTDGYSIDVEFDAILPFHNNIFVIIKSNTKEIKWNESDINLVLYEALKSDYLELEHISKEQGNIFDEMFCMIKDELDIIDKLLNK